MCTDWFADVVGVVTKVSTNGARRIAVGGLYGVFERRSVAAASESLLGFGIVPVIHRFCGLSNNVFIKERL